MGQTGVRYRRHRHFRVAGEVTQRLVHLGRAGGTVEADDIGSQRLESGQGRADLGPGQHPPGELDGDLDLERDLDTGALHRPSGALDGGFGTKEVELGLDDQEVGAPVDQPGGFDLIRIGEISIGDLAQGGELGAGADRPCDESGPSVCFDELVHSLSGQRRPGRGDLIRLVLEPVLTQGDGEGSEGVGLDHIDADFEEGAMEVPDHVGTTQVQQLVTSLQRRTPEVVGSEADHLQVGARSPVEDDESGLDGIYVVARPSLAHRSLLCFSSKRLKSARSRSSGNSSIQALAPCLRRLPRFHRA